MLRNHSKVGIKKMITDNGLVSLIPSVQCRDLCCSSEYGIQWIRKSKWRSRDLQRRDESIFHTTPLQIHSRPTRPERRKGKTEKERSSGPKTRVSKEGPTQKFIHKLHLEEQEEKRNSLSCVLILKFWKTWVSTQMCDPCWAWPSLVRHCEMT